MNDDATSFLMGGGVASAKFPTPGTTVGGRIVDEPQLRQQTSIDGDPLTWDNGDPRMQLVVRVQTDERADSEDDGIRAIYIKGQMQKAVADAVRKSGARGLQVGGTLTVTYTGDGEQKKRGYTAPKLYTATYTAAAAVNAEAFLNTAQSDPAPAQPAGNAASIIASLTDEQKRAVGIPV